MSIDSRASGGPAGMGCVRMPVDMSTGHGCWPPTVPATGSVTTFTDQFAQVRVSDMWVVHCCPIPGCHVPVTIIGSTTTFADQLPKQRMGDAMSCGDMAATGSLTAFAG